MKKILLFSLFFITINAEITAPEDKLPRGSYRNSCKNCAMEVIREGHETKITCDCQLINGQYNRFSTSHSLQPCDGDSTDLSCRSCENIGGALSCYDPHNH